MNPINFCPACGNEWAATPNVGGYASCGKCGWQLYENPVPVVAAIVIMGEQTVLVRNHGWPDKMLGLVTGYLEKNEDPAEAVAREVTEELHLNAKQVRFIGHHTFTTKNQLLIGFEVVVEHGDICLNEELAEYKLVNVAQLKGWSFGTGHLVQMWVDQQRKKL